MYYYTMWHKGGIKESFETLWEIEERTFRILAISEIYEYYGYDQVLKAHRWILNKIEKNLGMPTWLIRSDKELY